MTKTTYTLHVKDKIQERNFPNDYPRKVYFRPTQKHYDTVNNTSIAIRELLYNGAVRPISIAFSYDKRSKRVKIVTIHPEKQTKIDNKVIRGRWIKR